MIGANQMERLVSLTVALTLHIALGWALISTVASGTSRPATALPTNAPFVIELLPLGRQTLAVRSQLDATELPHRAAQAIVRTRAPSLPRTREGPSPTQTLVVGQSEHRLASLAQTPVTVGLPSEEAQSWRDSVQTHLARYRLYPPDAAREGRGGQVSLHFTVKRDGTVAQAWIATSSGVADIDHETIAAILRAQPLPPFPAGWPDTLDITLPVAFHVG